jgi:hypothetical protein
LFGLPLGGAGVLVAPLRGVDGGQRHDGNIVKSKKSGEVIGKNLPCKDDGCLRVAEGGVVGSPWTRWLCGCRYRAHIAAPSSMMTNWFRGRPHRFQSGANMAFTCDDLTFC